MILARPVLHHAVVAVLFVLLLAVAPYMAPIAFAETVRGTNGANVLTGRATASTIEGLGGADRLYGDPVIAMKPPRSVKRASVGRTGEQGDFGAIHPAVSANGGRLLFLSSSPQFHANLPPGTLQLFSKNLLTGVVKLESAGSSGEPFDVGVHDDRIAISPNGRYAAFSSKATNIPEVELTPANAVQLILKDLKTGRFTLVSQTPGNKPGGGNSVEPAFSADGTMLAFTSSSNNLVVGDDNMVRDVFLVRMSAPTRVFLASATAAGGVAYNGSSTDPVFSPAGGLLAFTSSSDTLLGPPEADRNGTLRDVFLKTIGGFPASGMIPGAVELVATDAAGQQDDTGYSYRAAFSPDGREVAFVSTADNLVDDDTTAFDDLFIKTIRAGGARPRGTVRIISRTTEGKQANGSFYFPTFSPDGTRLAFANNGNQLAAGSDNGKYQIVIKDLTVAGDTGKSTLISRNLAAGGEQGDEDSTGPLVFLDHGGRLLFTSAATNLVGSDGNGAADVFIATLAPSAGGNDVIRGGPGRDTLIGGPGADRLTGGKGADVFLYRSISDSRPKRSKRDTITDFNVAQRDVIDLSAIDANARKAGNQAFRFIGSKPFNGKPGRLRFSNGILSGDVTGNRKPDFAIRVHVKGKLTARRIRL